MTGFRSIQLYGTKYLLGTNESVPLSHGLELFSRRGLHLLLVLVYLPMKIAWNFTVKTLVMYVVNV